MSVIPPRAGIATASLLASTAIIPPPALAQEGDSGATRHAEPVVVEATRIPTELDKTGTAVTVITEADIEAAGDRTVTDTLRRVPGVDISQQGGPGTQSSVFLRGANAEHTLVVVDGVEVNDPSSPAGSFNFGGLTASNIEKIEILRGPQSTLYGSDAIGGVISITTKGGTDGLSANAFVEGGSFETVRGSGTIRGGDDRAQGSLTVSGTHTEGESAADENNGNDERDGFQDLTASAKGTVFVTDRLSLNAAGTISSQDTEFDNAPTPGNLQTDSDNESDSRRISTKLEATHTALNGRLENTVALEYLNNDRQNRSGAAVSFESTGQRRTFAYEGTFDVTDWLVVTAGAESENSDLDTASPQFGTSNADSFTTNSGFGLVQVTPIDRLTVTGGVRHDASDNFDDTTTFRASAAYNLRETGTTLRAMWGEGFNAPTLSQLTFTNAGITLKPEESESWEIGVEQSILDNRLTGRVTYFNQDIDNLIQFDQAAFTNRNLGDTTQQGLEVGLEATLATWASLSANYTYLDAEDDNGNQLIRRAEHKASGHLRLTPTDRARLATSVTYTGKRPDQSGGQRVTLDDYILVSFRGGYDVTQTVEVFGRVENALNEQYQTTFGFGSPDVAGYAGVRVSF
jgi:vitamin B12 transporter